MKIDEQRRRIIANAMVDSSFLNIVPNSQFNAPTFPANQTPTGVAYSKDRTKMIILGSGVPGSSPSNQKRFYCYSNSNPIGIAESATDLTYVGLSNDLVFEISSVRQQIAIGIHWDSDLGKIWLHHSTDTKMISEYDFNFSTLTATYVRSKVLTLAFVNGNFYFNDNYTELYTSESSGTPNFAKYTLSTAGDISTATLSFTKSGIQFTNYPIFFESGTSAIFSAFQGGSGQSELRKKQLATAYDVDSFLGTGYTQPFYRTGNIALGMRTTAQLPIIASIGLKKINYFSSNNSDGGGRIGVGTFDSPLDFEGLGDGLGGVKIGTTIVTY